MRAHDDPELHTPVTLAACAMRGTHIALSLLQLDSCQLQPAIETTRRRKAVVIREEREMLEFMFWLWDTCTVIWTT
jgi:hypothetical protein